MLCAWRVYTAVCTAVVVGQAAGRAYLALPCVHVLLLVSALGWACDS